MQTILHRLLRIGLRGDVEELGRRGLVHQIDALFFKGYEKIVELVGIDFLVGKIFVDFVVGQIALGFSFGDELLQIFIEMVHQTTPFTPLFGVWVCERCDQDLRVTARGAVGN